MRPTGNTRSSRAGFAVIVPIVSLIVGSSVIGSEIDDGTIVHIMTKPIPRSEIVLSKLAVAAGVTGLVNGAMLVVCGWIITGPRLAIGLGVGGAVASICYSALFVALSLVSRRPVLIGWCTSCSGRVCSQSADRHPEPVDRAVRGDAVGADRSIGPVCTDAVHRDSVVMSLVFLVVATVIAIDRLRAFAMRGETS